MLGGAGLDREDGSYKIQTFGVKTREFRELSRGRGGGKSHLVGWGGGPDPLSYPKLTCWGGGGVDPPKAKPRCWGGGLDREDGSYKIQTFGVKTQGNHLFSGNFPCKNREIASLFSPPQSGWLGGGSGPPKG